MNPRRSAELRARARGLCQRCFHAPIRWAGSPLCVKCGVKQRERMAHRWRVKRRKRLTLKQAARSLLAALDCGREWHEQARALRVLLAASERVEHARKCRRKAA